jgi:hypothetical protein
MKSEENTVQILPDVERAWFPARPCKLVIQFVVLTEFPEGVGYINRTNSDQYFESSV